MASTKSAGRRARRTAALLDLAQLGQAQWFFGDLYEAVVKIPELLSNSAQQTHARSVLGPGSPVRYYLPAVPVALGAPSARLSTDWTAPAAGVGWPSRPAAGRPEPH